MRQSPYKITIHEEKRSLWVFEYSREHNRSENVAVLWAAMTTPSIQNNTIQFKSRRLIWAGHVAKMEDRTSAFKILTGASTRKRPLGRVRQIWEDNIRINL